MSLCLSSIRRILALLVGLGMVCALTACGGGTDISPLDAPQIHPTVEPMGTTAQGVTGTTILVGNTVATTGVYASVGVPFQAGLTAALEWYNRQGGFRGKRVELVHHDDGFDARQGMACTRMLVEEDRVFALVGHFGTYTISATLDYLKDVGIPVMYAATSLSALYQEEAIGKNGAIFPVFPIYDAEGRVLLARALAPAQGGYGLGGTKVGVIASTDAVGEGILAGIRRQAREKEIPILYQAVDTDYGDAVSALQKHGCDVVIAAMSPARLMACLYAMEEIGYQAKVLTSHVADLDTLGPLADLGIITEERPVYVTAWTDVHTESGLRDMQEFVEIQRTWEEQQGIAPSQTFTGDSYAMAGYMAARLFLHGLEQVEAQNLELTWENYRAAVESKPYHIPTGGDIDYANGQRMGVTAFSLNTIARNPSGIYEIKTVSPILDLDEIWERVS